MSSAPAGADSIGEYLVSARSFEEYRAMFALTDADLAGRVLDCPGGGASFTATAAARGVDVVAVDPAYRTPAGELAGRMTAELRRGEQWARANAERYVWDFYGDPDGHQALRTASAELFVADRAARPDRYVAAALPSLPFADGSVDLVLSSHLLFTYADRLDHEFHLAALREMARVSRGEVRVYPLVDQAGHPLPDLVQRLGAELQAGGLQPVVREVGYEFQRGARSMLALRGGG